MNTLLIPVNFVNVLLKGIKAISTENLFPREIYFK